MFDYLTANYFFAIPGYAHSETMLPVLSITLRSLQEYCGSVSQIKPN